MKQDPYEGFSFFVTLTRKTSKFQRLISNPFVCEDQLHGDNWELAFLNLS